MLLASAIPSFGVRNVTTARTGPNIYVDKELINNCEAEHFEYSTCTVNNFELTFT